MNYKLIRNSNLNILIQLPLLFIEYFCSFRKHQIFVVYLGRKYDYQSQFHDSHLVQILPFHDHHHEQDYVLIHLIDVHIQMKKAHVLRVMEVEVHVLRVMEVEVHV
jgi:hypothetical protein